MILNHETYQPQDNDYRKGVPGRDPAMDGAA
jgi:hypothetical protein